MLLRSACLSTSARGRNKCHNPVSGFRSRRAFRSAVALAKISTSAKPKRRAGKPNSQSTFRIAGYPTTRSIG